MSNVEQVEKMLDGFEVHKKSVDERLTAKEQTIEKMSKDMDANKAKIAQIEKSILTPMGMVTKDAVDSEYKSAFREFLKSGPSKGLSAMHSKALSAGADPDGGFLVSSELAQEIQTRLTEISPIRQLAAVTNISSDSLDIIEENAGLMAGWTTEYGAVKDTATMTFNKKRIVVNELYAQPKATQKLLDDSYVDVEAWLTTKLAEAFSQNENRAFIHGDGNAKPKGFLSYKDGNAWGEIEQIKSGVDGAVTADSLFKLYYSMKSAYAEQGAFLMERTTIQAIRTLKDANTGQYLWSPGLNGESQSTLLGVPVFECADMPVAAAGSLSIVFADFKKAYQIVDREGIRILRDPYTDKPFVKFYTTKRVGGDVVNFDAIKLLKLSA